MTKRRKKIIDKEAKKKKILNLLKDGEKSTSEIRKKTKIHYYQLISLLDELEDEGKVTYEEKPHVTFWRLT